MTEVRTIAFVDLAGYTALTEAHGDHVAVGLIDDFVALVVQSIDSSVQLVKTIGDAVMLAAPEPIALVASVRDLFEACHESDAFPEPRAGLHHGEVIARGDDWFGGTVNLAARIASRAGGAQVLGTDAVADAARSLDIETVDVGEHELRNIVNPVRLWAVEVCTGHVDLSVDPVCRMRLSCRAAPVRVRYAGIEHWFCSVECAQTFLGEPDRYV